MKKWTSKLLTFVYLAIFLYSGFSLAKYLYTYYETSKSLEEVQTIYESTLATLEEEAVEISTEDTLSTFTIRPQFNDLLTVNKNIVGWISVEGTKLNNPILQTDNNDFYLNRNFKNQESRAGSVFMDYRNDVQDMNQNTILYGHAMKNGTMFGSLKNYLQQDYAEAHPIIYLDTLYEGYDVEVFAAYETTIDFYYIETEFKSNDAFLNFLDEIQARSAIEMNVDIGPEDKILTLSTCKDSVMSDDHRFVVQGKLVKR
ncbi:class B sortase [Lysinibacillus agricola]|uniref:Class B sortase n=1 Tax=Lysinibacillus agricola TaxID=2590012 RepID=A0ABX7AVS5_9BACI|nr:MULTISPECIES: class B sortase [Lysinibacillus]KOS62526.1 sortase [Lysinibacillus sp. FJAT-14222]QQP13367.1 class B sortase [Lysinibacillus agricola]